jgi:hypothetical protein
VRSTAYSTVIPAGLRFGLECLKAHGPRGWGGGTEDLLCILLYSIYAFRLAGCFVPSVYLLFEPVVVPP